MTDTTLLELEGSVETVVYHNDENQYTVLEMNTGEELVTVVGAFPFISEGEELHVFGKWSSHATYGEQFRMEAFEHSRPATTAAMLRYLSSGTIKGIGRSLAKRIVNEFGDRSLEVIQNEPKRLSQIKGITLEKANKFSQELQLVFGIRELMTYLSGFGIRPEEAVLVWKKYGSDSIACVQEEPYSLCEEDIGIGFRIADSVAESMERSADDVVRIKAGILYVLRHNLNNGHTCLPMEKLVIAAVKMLGVVTELVEDGIFELCQDMSLVGMQIGGRDFLFLPAQYQSEAYIADRMKMLLKYPAASITGVEEEIARVEAEKGIKYAGMQKEAIRVALERGILILTGGPGTGKTTTLNAIIHILKEKGVEVLLAAPTGRAAKRMSDLTGEEAKTIHRLLEVEWDNSDNPTFRRNERNQLECECIVIDELSMVDSGLFESVLRALPLSCRLVFVGDSDQLPSVGAGNVLGDLKASGLFASVELKEIFRQAQQSLIVRNAHRVVEGHMPELTCRDSDFFYMPRRSADQTAETIVELCSKRLPDSYGYSPVNDIQVLCPGRKGSLGTTELNKQLRQEINPPAKGKIEAKVNGVVFRQGDKVMQVKNDYDLVWEKDDGTSGAGVFNGDMGVITGIDPPAAAIYVQMDDKTVSYSYEHAYAELELAYAVTVHKSQGNEFPAVIIPLLGTVPMLCYRNLFYTAITRAKKLLILVGTKKIVSAMVENDRKTKRYTGLPYMFNRSENEPNRGMFLE